MLPSITNENTKDCYYRLRSLTRSHTLLLCANSKDFYQTVQTDMVMSSVAQLSQRNLYSKWYISGIARKRILSICEQKSRKSTCESAQSDQRLCYSLLG